MDEKPDYSNANQMGASVDNINTKKQKPFAKYAMTFFCY